MGFYLRLYPIATPFTSILKIIRVDFSVANLVYVGESSTIDRFRDNEVNRIKDGARTAKSKSKSENLVKSFLTKS